MGREKLKKFKENIWNSKRLDIEEIEFPIKFKEEKQTTIDYIEKMISLYKQCLERTYDIDRTTLLSRTTDREEYRKYIMILENALDLILEVEILG